MKYRIVTNGFKFKVQRNIPWYKHLPFGKWIDISWEYETKEGAQACLDVILKDDHVANLEWKSI